MFLFINFDAVLGVRFKVFQDRFSIRFRFKGADLLFVFVTVARARGPPSKQGEPAGGARRSQEEPGRGMRVKVKL